MDCSEHTWDFKEADWINRVPCECCGEEGLALFRTLNFQGVPLGFCCECLDALARNALSMARA